MSFEPAATTLRQLAGLPAEPPLVSDAILLVVDAQEAYSATGELTVDGGPAAVDAIGELLDCGRSAGSTIIHIAHQGSHGSAFDPRLGGRFIAETKPVAGEAIVHKTLPNAFAGTDLLRIIHAAAPRPLILCGFMTHMCVSSTARAALDLGIETAIARDATATRDLPATSGSDVIPAKIVHEAALAALADRFSIVTTSRHLLNRG